MAGLNAKTKVTSWGWLPGSKYGPDWKRLAQKQRRALEKAEIRAAKRERGEG